MTREKLYQTQSPTVFVIGADVYNEPARLAIKGLNWVNANRPQLHISQTVAPSGWAESTSPRTHNIVFRASGAIYEVFRIRIKVLPETTTIVVGAECAITSPETGSVHFSTYDDSGTQTATAEITFDNGDNDAEKTSTLATSSTGTGWITITVAVEGTSAGIAGDSLRQFRIQDQSLSTLAAPVIEGTCETLTVT